MNRWLEELQFAWRSLARTPVVSMLSILTLALGIGAATAIFTVLNGVVLAPLEYPDSNRLVRLVSPVPGMEDGAQWNLSAAQYFHFKEHAEAVDAIGVWQVNAQALRMGEHSARAIAGIVSGDVMSMIGATTARGRLISPADDTPGAAPVAVLAHEYWQREFAADASVIGSALEIEGQVFEVVGIMQPGVRLPGQAGAPALIEQPDVWIPQRLNPAGPFPNSHVYMAMGRLAAPGDLDRAQAEIAELTARLPEAFPETYNEEFMDRFGFGTRLVPLKEFHIGDTDRHLWLLFAMVVLVLMVALANVVNLFLVRFESRHQELMVRAALGASLGGLGRYVLSQSMMIAGISAIFALGAAFWGVEWLMARVPETLPRADNVGLDAIGVLFVVGLAMIVGVLLTLFVLLRLRADAVRPAIGSESHRTTASFRQQQVRAGLVAAQIAIALVLMVGAGTLFQSFIKLSNIDPGFVPDHVARMQLHLPRDRYRAHTEVWQFYRELLERAEALPGVEVAGAGNPLPLSGEYGCWAQGFEDAAVEQRMRERGGTACGDIVVTAPGFFEALGVPVIAGRTLTAADLDHPESGAVVVSQAFAERFWPGEDPLGKGVRPMAAPAEVPRYSRVVGVVGDLPASSLEGAPAMAVYYPIVPVPGEGFAVTPSRHLNLVVKARDAEALPLMPSVRELVRELDPAVTMDSPAAMAGLVSRSTSRLRFSMSLLIISGLAGLFLASVGLYGVVSYVVAGRTHEMGIRMALGAARKRVQRLVMTGSMKMVGAGLLIGIVAAVLLTRVLHGMFFGIQPGDPATYLLAAGLLLGVTLAAAYIPARHAARVEPMEALRHE